MAAIALLNTPMPAIETAVFGSPFLVIGGESSGQDARLVEPKLCPS